MGKFWDFVGKQLARMRFGVTYIQMFYYASVMLGVVVLVVENVLGADVIGWEISLGFMVAIFVFLWLIGFVTDRKRIIEKDVFRKMKQDIPGRMNLQKEIWTAAQVPLIEELTERVVSEKLKQFMKDIYEELENAYE